LKLVKSMMIFHKIPNTLNNHFSEIGPKLASNINDSIQTGTFSCILLIQLKTTWSFYLRPTTNFAEI